MNKNKRKELLEKLNEKKKYKKFFYFIFLVITILLVTNFRTRRLESMTFDIKVVSTSNNEMWSNDTQIEIFNSNRNDSKDNKIIYPGVSGEYYFKIYNDMSIDIDYVITGYDIGSVIPKMQYQLYKVNSSHSDEWLPLEKILVNDNLKSKGECEYVLRWMWDEEDSLITNGGEYTLHLVVDYTVD